MNYELIVMLNKLIEAYDQSTNVEITFNNPDTLDESTNVYTTRDKSVKIYVRTKDGSFVSGDGHPASIKIYANGKNMDIAIPTKAYNTLRSNDRANKMLNRFIDEKFCSPKDTSFIVSFIYNYQMAIIAYWYSTDLNNRNIEVALEKYLHRAFKRRSIPKSVTELEADKEMLTNYVRKECQDDTIILHFGS